MTSPTDVIDEEAGRWRVHSNGVHTSQAESRAPWDERLFEVGSEWFTTPPAPRAWLLRDERNEGAGVLPLGKVGMVIGEGGVSKTMCLVALAIAVATGGKWLGSFDVAAPGRVLAIFGEEDGEEVRRRMYHVARSARAPAPPPSALVVLALAGLPCPMVETDGYGERSDAAFLRWLLDEVRKRGPFSLIIVDPLSRFAGMDAEVDNAAATRFVQALESLAAASGATVLVVHHTNKASRHGLGVSGASARGSSAFYDGVRWAACLSPEHVDLGEGEMFRDLTTVVRFDVVKSNYAAIPRAVVMRRDPAGGGALVPLDDVELEMVSRARHSKRGSARRQRASQDRYAEVGSMIREILKATPGLSGRALHAALIDRRGSCSRDVLHAGLVSLGAEIRTERGPDNATLHYLAGQDGEA